MTELNDQIATQSITTVPDSKEMPIISKFWRGKTRLWKSVWVLGVLVHIVMFAVALFMRAVNTPLPQALFITQVITIPLYTFWLVSIWRSAWRTSHWIFSIISRGLAILIALGVLSALINLAAFGGKL